LHSSWLVIVAIVLGIVGVVAKGLLYLLIIGIVVFLGALRMRRRPAGTRTGNAALSPAGAVLRDQGEASRASAPLPCWLVPAARRSARPGAHDQARTGPWL
jgi:hypothetical protein